MSILLASGPGPSADCDATTSAATNCGAQDLLKLVSSFVVGHTAQRQREKTDPLHCYKLLTGAPFAEWYFSFESALLGFGAGALIYFWREQRTLFTRIDFALFVSLAWLINFFAEGTLVPEGYAEQKSCNIDRPETRFQAGAGRIA